MSLRGGGWGRSDEVELSSNWVWGGDDGEEEEKKRSCDYGKGEFGWVYDLRS